MRRLLMILSVCGLVLVTGACSGDDGNDNDGDEGKDAAGVNASMDPKEQRKRAAKTSNCEAEVSTTGAYEAEWGGKAQVRTGGKSVDAIGPKAVYTLSHKKNRVSLYSPGSEFKGAVSLSVGDVAYSSDPADAGSLDIDKRGKSANVDVTLTSIDGETVDLVADFTCGKPKKKKQ